MIIRQWASQLLSITVLAAAVVAGTLAAAPQAQAQTNRVFEMRTYTTHEGKLDDLQAHFRNHTVKFSRNTA